MNHIQQNIKKIQLEIQNTPCKLIAVSKTKPISDIQQAYEAGIRHFGENKVQEMTEKAAQLPKDICWHLIGHLQRNKVKYIAEFVHLIHAIDSLKLLQEVNKRALQHKRIIDCLIQIHIAEEETKFGMDKLGFFNLLSSDELASFQNIRIVGLMGMATFTSDKSQIHNEFRNLKSLFEEAKTRFKTENIALKELSMGMSGDYGIAIDEGSTMLRVGSAIFGMRN